MPYARIVPVVDATVRGLCAKAYPRHPHGCPNFGHQATCPPEAPLLLDVFDLAQSCFVVWNVFDLAAHVAFMRVAHPTWSKAQLECCLYWQGSARKHLNGELSLFRGAYPKHALVTCPEAMGLNVTATMKSVGIELEWPPVTMTYQVAFAGIARSEVCVD